MSNSAFTPSTFGQGIVVPGVSPGQVSALGLPGDTSGGAVTSGYLGEYIESKAGLANYTQTSGSWFTQASISLPAGDWDVTAQMYVSGGVMTRNEFLVSTNSGATGAQPGDTQIDFPPATGTYNSAGTLSDMRFNHSSTTVIYLRVNLTYSGTPQIGYRLSARRRR